MSTDVSAIPGLSFDERITELYRYFASRRAAGPVAPSQQDGVWEVFSYDGTLEAMRDHGTFSNGFSDLTPNEDPNIREAARGTLVHLDPPRHTRLRALVGKAFTPRVVEDIAPHVDQLAERILDDLLARPGEAAEFDLAHDFAGPLSATVLAELFGIPQVDYADFAEWTDIITRSRPEGELRIADEESRRSATERIQYAVKYMMAHVARLRADPGPDLTSKLTTADIDGEFLSDGEIVGMVGQFLVAGHLPTSLLVGNTIMCLEENPAAFDELRSDPELLPAVLDEVLRYRPPFVRDQRLTTRDVEFHGQRIPRHSMVVLWVGSANRDERYFPDPDRFDIHREHNPHLTFGRGIHFCIGAPLTRLIVSTALTTLLRRCADLRVVRDGGAGGVRFHGSIGVLGPLRLPVTCRVR